MKTQTIHVVYVNEQSCDGASHPSGVAIMSALVENLGIEIIHSEPHGNMHRLTLHDDVDIEVIRHVLHKAFPHALSIFLEKPEPATDTLDEAHSIFREAAALMKAKNADYGDSWRLMRLSSITDQILVKIHRVKTIEMSPDAPKVSEGVESEYRDILNYCIFAILKLREEKREV